MKRAYLILIALVLFAGCKKDNGGPADSTGLRVTHSQLDFNYSATSYPVTVMTGEPWTLESNASWLSASIDGAPQGKTFFIQAEQNTGEQRTGIITISNERGAKTIKVTQKADDRNFTEISFSCSPKSYERLTDATLVIPYRKGDGMTLENVTAEVAGPARGTIAVELLDCVTLEKESGSIRLAVSGRTGESGNLLFTVSGLPSTVFGDAAQCCVQVAAGEPLADIPISDLRKLPLGEISKICRVEGLGVSKTGNGVFEEGIFFLQDNASGIRVRTEGQVAAFGDRCRIFVTGGTLSREDGALTLTLCAPEDMEVISKDNPVTPVRVESLPLDSYESMYCSVSYTQITTASMSKTTFSGRTEMERLTWKGNYDVFVPELAAFAGKGILTGSGTVNGIVTPAGQTGYVIVPAEWEDLAGLTGERLNLDARFEVEKDTVSAIPAAGATGLSIKIRSSVNWRLDVSGCDWAYGWSATSGFASDDWQTISFSAAGNAGARRNAVVTFKGNGVPDIDVMLIQLEGQRVLDCDFSLVKAALADNPKYFPVSAGTDYAKTMGDIGMDGWSATNCYGALSPDGEYGMLRIGKTLTKGYLQTPALSAIGQTPTNIEVSLLAGIYKGCKFTWLGVELVGPGTLVTGDDMILVENYDDAHTAAKLDKLPMYVIEGLGSSAPKRVVFRVDGATEATAIRLTATVKGGSAAADCDMFFVGDFHVDYRD